MAVNAQAYFAANPDVAASFASNNYGMTADEFANFHFANYGASESRTPPTGVTNEQILTFLKDNPNLTDEQIVSSMKTYGISPSQMAGAVGLNEGEIASRVAATVPYGQTVTLGDTIVQPVYQVTGSGDSEQIGGLENVITYKATDNRAGGSYTQYTPTGEVEKTGTQQEVKSGLKEFALGAALLFGLPSLLNAGAAGAPAIGNGAFLGEGVASGIPAFDTAFTNAGGVFNSAFGLPVGNGAFLGEGVLSGVPASDLALANATVGATGLTAAQIAALTAQDLAIGGGALAGTAPATIPGLLTPAATALTPTATIPAATTLTPAATTTIPAATTTIPAATAAATAAATGLGGLTAAQLASLLSTGLTTGAGLLQQQTSREAAQAALQMINAETAAAKQGAQFRPIGMTTRFGTSQFVTDPVTGRLTSAGYTLDPQAKNAQDRLVKLAESGLVQAEGAQKAFEPLQTGAQSLFKLGQGYLAEKPETVAENYLKSQMALLKPGRDLELANIETRLRNQGRLGLSVAQGGNLGAASPELQALYNARAQQEAQLAANAQQFGQQQINFGAGLLGQGASAMGQYYGGQQQAYSPFTTALGQVQGLEQLAQQPLQMGINLGQIGAQTGFDAGRLGLQGAGQATTLATGPAATNNPYATLLGGLGASPTFGAAGVNALGRLFG